GRYRGFLEVDCLDEPSICAQDTFRHPARPRGRRYRLAGLVYGGSPATSSRSNTTPSRRDARGLLPPRFAEGLSDGLESPRLRRTSDSSVDPWTAGDEHRCQALGRVPS